MPLKREPAPPIAIIGMGMRLPGGISSADQFWDLLINKRDGRCRVPLDRYNVDGFYGAETHRQNTATDHGYFLDTDIKGFDTSMFGINRADMGFTDPQLRLLLEVVWECMENAGQTELRGTDTGVFVGVFGEDWHNMLHKDTLMQNNYRVLSAGDYALANMLSWEFDLSGPSMTLRTACSSSLSALHTACQSLYTGDCSRAIVAGSSLIMDPSMTMDMTAAGVLSPTGSCETFDVAADGYARGEAVNAILLKPLEDAVRDGDPVRAVIRSTAVNSDGKTSHIGCPSSESQIKMIRKAYEKAGIHDISQTPFVECHGTGTVRGDPIEASAVASVFGKRGTYIGSVKPNVGHGEGAAALTSIIKAILSLENEIIPPNVNFSTPNPNIPFDEFNLRVPVEPVPWPPDRCSRISVSSFGIGGANGHVIIDSAASFGVCKQPRAKAVIDASIDGDSVEVLDSGTSTGNSSDCNSVESFPADSRKRSHSEDERWIKIQNSSRNHAAMPYLIPISAGSETALKSRVDSLKWYTEKRSGSVPDTAYTLSHKRIHLPHRTFCIATDEDQAILDVAPFSAGVNSIKAREVAFVFTGQGAQWNGMVKSLMDSSPEFLDDMRHMDRALQRLNEAPSWSIVRMLLSDSDTTTDIGAAEFSQPLCTAIQIALVNFVQKCGIMPSAVIGHSSGEIAAAYAAGALTMDEAIICAYFRGIVAKDPTQAGSMAAIGMSQADIMPFLSEGVVVACDNSPKSVTISGDADGVDSSIESIQAAGVNIFTRKLRLGVAYHSPHMKAIGKAYEKLLSSYVTPRCPSCPFYSTVSGDRLQSTETIAANYWRSNLESPVLFYQGMKQLLQDIPNIGAVVEFGPHSALQGPIREILQHQTLKQRPIGYMATLVRNKRCVRSILCTIGNLFAKGYAVEFSALCPLGITLTDLPPYTWDKPVDVWRESRLSMQWRHRKHAHHELLGSRCMETTGSEPAWRNIIYQHDISWLTDHKVDNDVVFPVAGFVAAMGEAIRQMTGSNSYQLRNVMVKAALLIPNIQSTELMTSLRPHRVTGLSNSTIWYDISISTFDGIAWVENCVAQGKAQEGGCALDASTMTVAALPRKLKSKYFYDRMQYSGLKYGTSFQVLEDISCHTEENIAVATLHNESSTFKAYYAAHPTVIDGCIQLCAVAEVNGLARNLDTLVLPVMFEKIIIKPANSDLIAQATINSEQLGNTTAMEKGNDRVCIDIRNVRCVPFNLGENVVEKDIKLACRVQWLPDIECSPQSEMMARTQSNRDVFVTLEAICILTTLQVMDFMTESKFYPVEHLVKYRSRLQRIKTDLLLQSRRPPIVPEALNWLTLGSSERQNLLSTFCGKSQIVGYPNAANIAGAIGRLSQPDVLLPVLDNTEMAANFLLENDVISSVSDIVSETVNVDRFLHLCGHVNPGMRVLELGGGTGVASHKVLKSLVSEDGVRMYSQYFFTDDSSSLFEEAKKRLSGHAAVEFKCLDIGQSPEPQGFEAGSFDLIIASNPLHSTARLQHCLKNIRSLLRSGGRFYFQMLQNSNFSFIDMTMGLLPDWWVGENSQCPGTLSLSADEWDRELKDAGFSGNDELIENDESLYRISSHIITTAHEASSKPRKTIFIYKTFRHSFGIQLATELEKNGHQVEWVQLSHEIDCDEATDVVSAIDLEGPLFADICSQDYEIFMSFVQKLKSGLLWLTRSAQIGCTDPRYGIGLGLFRTIRNELSMEFWTLELDNLDGHSVAAALSVMGKFHERPVNDIGRKLDTEYVCQQGVVQVGRYHWTSLDEELLSKGSKDPKQLVIGRYGLLNSMHWVKLAPCSLQDNEVEVSICSVGLNFRDVMVAMGIVNDSKDSLGLEASGVVTRVGSVVQHLKAGDRVATLSRGLLATKKVVRADQVIKIPDHLSFEEAATIPVVYATAMYAITHLGQLKKNQSILIHSGTGGVGQAAIRISQLIGATIYTTVGSEEKAQYITNTFGIPRDRIFDSHTDSFLANIMKATHDQGVDMVLNSLSGELLHASWECVAKHGKMMEIGKRDMIEHGRLDLNRFQGNRTLYGIDVGDLWKSTPERLLSIIGAMANMNATSQLKPIQPIHSFSMDDISEALQFLKKGKHIGKIVLSVPESPELIPAATHHEPNLLSPVSTYLMVGGLRGLGRAVVRWMFEKGARSFCFLSRSAGSTTDDKEFLFELESLGCRATVVTGTVVDVTDVQRAIAESPTPIAGVLQMSMVLRDRALPDMDYESWRDVQDCKVLGTWNLHNALAKTQLDFFILVSSICGLAGQPGQANYASANSFLDSFMQYRHSVGLPCSVIDLGAVEGVGFLTTRPDKMSQYRTSGLFLLQEEHLMKSIRIAMERPSPADGLQSRGLRGGLTAMSQIALGLRSQKQISDPRTSRVLTADMRFRMYPNMDPIGQMDTESKDERLQVLLKAAEEDPSILDQPDTLSQISWEIGRTLFKFLALPQDSLDVHTSLESIGVDSLVSIEVRNWYRRTTGLDITVLEILKTGSIEGLGRKFVTSLKEKYKTRQSK